MTPKNLFGEEIEEVGTKPRKHYGPFRKDEVISSMHKEIRRGDVEAAQYWLEVLYQAGESGYYLSRYLWIVAAEDVDDLEVQQYACQVFIAHCHYKQVELHHLLNLLDRLCKAPKKWETDRGCELELREKRIRDEVRAAMAGERDPRPIPEYALDKHTAAGAARIRRGLPVDQRWSGSWEGVMHRISMRHPKSEKE